MIKKIGISAWPMIVLFIIDNIVFNPLGFYKLWWWFDIPMHILGGLLTAWSTHRFLVYLKKEKKITAQSLFFWYFLLVGSTAIIGILWEIYEFFLNILTGIITQPSVADTIGDFSNDLLGALVFCFGLNLVNSRKK